MVRVEVVRDARVAEVVAEAGHLLPADPHQRRAAHPRPGAAATKDVEREGERGEEEEGQPAAVLRVEPVVGLEEAAPEHLLPRRSEVGHVRVHYHVGHLADEKRRQHLLVHPRRVVVVEDVGRVLAGHVDHRPDAAGVLVDEFGDVVRSAVNDDPAVFATVVLRHLGHRELGQRLALQPHWQGRVQGDDFGDASFLPQGHRHGAVGCREWRHRRLGALRRVRDEPVAPVEQQLQHQRCRSRKRAQSQRTGVPRLGRGVDEADGLGGH
mmetsp:Transcript_10124/g.17316  ORF Transcript_10124/g.17316 Transcript_10124/m.17316 type:complete len:267 (-) Transcript_10124:56-856(-)